MEETPELKFSPGYNQYYTTEEDLASITATNIMSNLGVFDRIQLDSYQIVATKYFVGKDYGNVTLTFSMNRYRQNSDDPYTVDSIWRFNNVEMGLDLILFELDSASRKKLVFNLDYLSQKSINLKEYDKNGISNN